MCKRAQTLGRGRLEKYVVDRSLRFSGQTEEHLWGAEQRKGCKRICQAWWRQCDGLRVLWWWYNGTFVTFVQGKTDREEGRLSFCNVMHAIPCGQHLIGANYVLQQDNDSKHTSKLCQNYLGKKQSAGILSVMEWAAQPPDLNPIELL